MQLTDAELWQSLIDANQDGYGAAIMRYTEQWANLMEERMADGANLDDIAEQASQDADTEGITGFMYGCAVRQLAQCWEHGEALRLWNNEKYGISREKSAESKGVVNPAIMTISPT